MFDPEWLRPIIGELSKQAQPLARDSRRKDLTQLLTLVDGTGQGGTARGGTGHDDVLAAIRQHVM